MVNRLLANPTVTFNGHSIGSLRNPIQSSIVAEVCKLGSAGYLYSCIIRFFILR
jgi:hypothetical protein